jgi:hypothetical protein
MERGVGVVALGSLNVELSFVYDVLRIELVGGSYLAAIWDGLDAFDEILVGSWEVLWDPGPSRQVDGQTPAHCGQQAFGAQCGSMLCKIM